MPHPCSKIALRTLLALALAALVGMAPAKTLRIASAQDPQSMDPHALALLYHSRMASRSTNRWSIATRIPARAVARRVVEPCSTRPPGASGCARTSSSTTAAPFTADDAVFSIERALTPPSQRAFQIKGVVGAKKVDEQTIEC